MHVDDAKILGVGHRRARSRGPPSQSPAGRTAAVPKQSPWAASPDNNIDRRGGRDQTARNIEDFQQFGGRRDLVTLLVDDHLAVAQALTM